MVGSFTQGPHFQLALLQFASTIPIGIAVSRLRIQTQIRRAGLRNDFPPHQYVRSGAKSSAVAYLTVFIPIQLVVQLVCDSLITVSMIVTVSSYAGLLCAGF